MYDHVEFAVSSAPQSRAFYKAFLTPLGIEEFFFDANNGEAAFGKGDVAGLLIYTGELGPRRMHICFQASSKEEVAASYAAGLAAGGRDNGAPGYRPQYAPGYYAAFLLDPDGNNIEALFRDSAASSD